MANEQQAKQASESRDKAILEALKRETTVVVTQPGYLEHTRRKCVSLLAHAGELQAVISERPKEGRLNALSTVVVAVASGPDDNDRNSKAPTTVELKGAIAVRDYFDAQANNREGALVTGPFFGAVAALCHPKTIKRRNDDKNDHFGIADA